jgi:hypothetical protein
MMITNGAGRLSSVGMITEEEEEEEEITHITDDNKLQQYE